MWLMIWMLYVIVMLVLSIMLLKVIMREGNMVWWISTILSFLYFCWNSWSCTCFAFLCFLLYAFMTCLFTRLFFHRKWFRFKCVSYFIFNALYCFKFFCGAFALSSSLAPTWASFQITAPSSKALKKSTLGR
jgi:hypothetical protein